MLNFHREGGSCPHLPPKSATNLGMEEIRDPLKPPTACLGWKKKPYQFNKVRGDMSYCFFLSQCPQKNLPSHCIHFEALSDRTRPYDILAGSDLLKR